MFVLDTDHISVLQWNERPAADHLTERMVAYPGDEFALTVISFQEQVMGANALVQRAAKDDKLILAYRRFTAILARFSTYRVLDFDSLSLEVFHRLRAQGIRAGTMDLRIAAMCIANDAVLLTRNTTDFSRVPGLTFDDWTKPP